MIIFTLDETCSRKNFSDSSMKKSYSYPFFSELHTRFCTSLIRVSVSTVSERFAPIIISTMSSVFIGCFESSGVSLLMIPYLPHSSGKFTPHTGHCARSPLYLRSKYCIISTSQFQQTIFLYDVLGTSFLLQNIGYLKHISDL